MSESLCDYYCKKCQFEHCTCDRIHDVKELESRLAEREKEIEAFKKLFRGKDNYCETCVGYREALEKIAVANEDHTDYPEGCSCHALLPDAAKAALERRDEGEGK